MSKKFLTLLLLMVTIIILFCSCTNDERNTHSKNIGKDDFLSNEELQGEYENSNNINNEKNLIIMTEKDVYSCDENLICFDVINTKGRDDEMISESGYCLQIKKNSEWEYLKFNQELVIYGSAAVFGKKHELCLRLDDYYDLPLDAGIYRIVHKFDGIVSNEFQIIE